MIVCAAHRVCDEPASAGVVLKRVEGRLADDRLGDREARRAGRELEHGASLVIGGRRRRHSRA
jgi:hypothetical protein